MSTEAHPEVVAPRPATRTGLGARYEAFLRRSFETIYAEPDNPLSERLIRAAIEHHIQPLGREATARILDVGCGSGVALRALRAAGYSPEGLTLGPEAAACREEGFVVHERDIADLPGPAGSWDLLFCRHVLEHAVAPAFTLAEWGRALRVGGHAYVEVPCPETSALHEENPNHFSVLGNRMWQSLFRRSGFEIVAARSVDFRARCGPDRYWMYFLRRAAS